MPYAVLQTDLNVPKIEQLSRAFRSVPGLAAVDAHIIGRDAFGILVKDFSEQRAGALKTALRGEGVETEIVDQALLPSLPATHFVHRCDCRPEHLLIYDPLGRTFPLEWQHIMAIAAGSVQLTDFLQERREIPKPSSRGRYAMVEMETETVWREERNPHLLAEIIITAGTLRYSVAAEKFNFAYLGERNMKNSTANFSLFVRDLIQFSPNAVLNQGAATLRADATKTFSYPSKNAFYEEIVWMLWQMRKAV